MLEISKKYPLENGIYLSGEHVSPAPPLVDKDPDYDAVNILDIRQTYEDADAETLMSHTRALEIKWKLIATKQTPNPLDLNVEKELGYEQLLGDNIPEIIDERNSTSVLSIANKARKTSRARDEHDTSGQVAKSRGQLKAGPNDRSRISPFITTESVI